MVRKNCLEKSLQIELQFNSQTSAGDKYAAIFFYHISKRKKKSKR